MRAARHQHFYSITSTQVEALKAARSGDEGNLWITADVQTAGRGRMGRVWKSELGNLFASLLLRDVNELALRQALPFLTGLAIYNTIAPLLNDIQRSKLHLKWPNDLLWNGAKLAGILIEIHSSGQNTGDAVIIGIGVNVKFAPKVDGRQTCALSDMGIKLAAADVFKLLQKEFTTLWEAYQCHPDYATLLKNWTQYSLPMGEVLRITINETQKIGTYQGIDAGGALLLQLPDGTIETITAAEVNLLGE